MNAKQNQKVKQVTLTRFFPGSGHGIGHENSDDEDDDLSSYSSEES